MTDQETIDPTVLAVRDKIVDRLRTIYDPEIPVNIYDLGLIYVIKLDPCEDGRFALHIDMTLTAPGCPMADEILQMVNEIVLDIPELASINVALVWDPPWDASKISDVAKMELDITD